MWNVARHRTKQGGCQNQDIETAASCNMDDARKISPLDLLALPMSRAYFFCIRLELLHFSS